MHHLTTDTGLNVATPDASCGNTVLRGRRGGTMRWAAAGMSRAQWEAAAKPPGSSSEPDGARLGWTAMR
jgi:hypothetical protein